MNAPLLLIANPSAHGGRVGERLPGLRAQLARRGLAADAVLTTHAGHAVELARAHAARYATLVAVGGDGTVNEVATGILESGQRQVGLGVLPVGTGNDVAQLTGVETVEKAIEALARGGGWDMDVIEVSCVEAGRSVTHYALLFAAAGFAAAVLRRTTPRVKRWAGARYSYSVGFFRALFGHRSPRMRVQSGEVRFDAPLFHVCAGNAPFAGGGVMRLSPGARMDDGELDFCAIEALSVWQIPLKFPSLLRGTHVRHRQVRYWRGTRLSLEAEVPLDLALDGEVRGQTPATFAVRPRALRVLCGEARGAR